MKLPTILIFAILSCAMVYGSDAAEDAGGVVSAFRSSTGQSPDPADYFSLAPGEGEVVEALRLLDERERVPFSDVVSLFHRGARKGNAEAQFYMGVLHAFGVGVAKSDAKALSYYTMSALSGHPEAAVALSHRFENGIGLPQSLHKAAEYAKMASERVVKTYGIENRQRLPVVLLDDLQKKSKGQIRSDFGGITVDSLIQSHVYRSEQGNLESKMTLGYTYLYGLHSQPVDVQKALRHFEDALAKRHPQAYGALGQIYMQGIKNTQPPILANQERAFQLFESGQELGDPVSLNGLGYFYARSATLRTSAAEQEERFKKASEYYARSAALGNADGTYNLAVLKLHGKGLPKEPASARSLFQVAAGKGSVLANWQLGLLSMLGEAGMDQSDMLALRFFKEVMAKGAWNRHLRVALESYRIGNNRLSLIEYLIGSELGLPSAKSNALHILHRSEGLEGVEVVRYRSGTGMSASSPGAPQRLSQKEAMDDLTLTVILKSALEGDKTALLRLGDHYYARGNYTRALSCYEQASVGGGLPQAMFNIAYMYQFGLGTAGNVPDFTSAKRYYDATLERSGHLHDGDAYYAVQGALFVLNFHYWLYYFEGRNVMPFGSLVSSFSDINSAGVTMPLGIRWDDWLLCLSGVFSIALLLLRNQVADDRR